MPRNIQFPVENRAYFNTDEPTLTIGKRIITFETGETIGYIFLNVNESKISSIFPEFQGEQIKHLFFLTDSQNRIISTMDKESLLGKVEDEQLNNFLKKEDSSSEIRLDKEDYLFTKKKVENLEWSLISRISIGSLTADIRLTSGITILLGILGAVVALVLTILLSERITRPIGVLTNAAIRLQNGDFSVQCEMDSNDEVGTLAKAFQTMSLKIEGLLI